MQKPGNQNFKLTDNPTIGVEFGHRKLQLDN